MRIVHLATTDLGGSYKAVERIHKGLLLNGAESTVLLRTKFHEESVGTQVISSTIQSLVSKAKNVMNLAASKGEVIVDRFGTDMTEHPEVQKADVIMLHWVNSFISVKGVAELVSLGKPVIMVAHDMWCCTGGCHYDDYCERYRLGCGSCPMIGKGKGGLSGCGDQEAAAETVCVNGCGDVTGDRRMVEGTGMKVRKDVSYKEFWHKRRMYRGVTLVGPSSWSAQVARNSAIWDGNRIETILNPLDTEAFRPLCGVDKEEGRSDEKDGLNAEKSSAAVYGSRAEIRQSGARYGSKTEMKLALRKKYGVPDDKKVILYGAALALQNKTKGAQNIHTILKGLDPAQYRLVVFGNGEGESLPDLPIEATYLGYIHGDEAMCEVYNLADVFLVPSKQESFCYTVAEALACQVPVVSYGIGGILDQVRTGENGFLARFGHPEELTEGIRYCCERFFAPWVGNGNSLAESGKKYLELCEELVRGEMTDF